MPCKVYLRNYYAAQKIEKKRKEKEGEDEEIIIWSEIKSFDKMTKRGTRSGTDVTVS